MTDTKLNRRLFVAGLCLLVILTGCNPYTALATQPAAGTPSQTAPAQFSLRNEKPTPTPRPSCTVTGTVYLRPDASKAGAPLAVLHDGQRLTVMAGGDWLKVSTRQELTGFIYSRYCETGE